MSAPRRSRASTPEKKPVRLMARDVDILAAVGRMGCATTEHITRLFFGDTSTASRRLAKLVGARLLSVHLGRLDEPNGYVLTKGAVELLEAHDVEGVVLHRSKVGRQLDPHLRALNDVRVEFTLAERRGYFRVEAFHSDLDLRRAVEGRMPSYVPDAIVEIRLHDGEQLVLFVEIDLGTESTMTFASKVRVTVEADEAGELVWGFAPGSWIPVAIAPTAGRVRSLARAIVGAGGGDLWVLSEFAVLRERGLSGAVLARPADAETTRRGEEIAYRGRLVSPGAA